MNILIVKTSAIGDVTHTIPCLNALRANFPQAHITWLIEEEAADIILNHPALDRVIISKRKRWMRNFKAGKYLQTIRQCINLIKEIRDTHYDLLIDFQGLLKSSILIILCHAKRKAGFGQGMEHSECSHLFLNERVPPVDMNTHAVQRELQLLKSLGIKGDDAAYKLPISEAEQEEAKDILRAATIDDQRPFIAINPMTTWATKHWQNAGFAKLGDQLIDNGFNVVFTGSMGDQPAITEIINLMHGKAVNLAGRTTLKTVAAIFSQAHIVVSTDTGPMHIAAAVGTPVVAIFGPTAPWRTGPYGEQHTVIRTDISCSPCFKKICERGDHYCMQQIQPDQIFEAVQKTLRSHIPPRSADKS